jgi:subtilisin-like proprotein convertase family protein
LNFEGYPKTPPASFDNDTSWDVSPIAPFDKGDFFNNGDVEGTWSPWFGYGRVDAEAAVAEALRQVGPTGGKSFNGSSSPDRSIPDNNTAGIKDKIGCTDTFIVQSVKVRVDITHTYIGDLRVSLISPAGAVVILHDRAGGGTKDLHADFTATTTPGLLALQGQSVMGDWTLHVQDLAPADRGRLTGWSLVISGQADTSVTVAESPGVVIPDNLPAGIERTLAVAKAGQLDGINVEIDITHTYIGDLIVELIAPDNTAVLLHNRTGGTANNIIKTYTLANTSGLQILRGHEIRGNWKLKVSDRAGADQGKLNRWALKLTAM